MIKSSVGVIFCKNQSILMGLRQGAKAYNGLWGVPGGVVEEGETISEAAVREAEEEVGLSPIELSEPFLTKDGFTGFNLSFFLCTEWQGFPTNREPHICKEIRWINVNEIPKKTIDSIFHAIEHFRIRET